MTNIYNKQKERSLKKGWPLPEYSLVYLQEKYLNDKKFNELYLAWVKSEFKKPLKPSIDRIDCKKHYTKDNIQIMTWAENREKENKEFSILRAKTVYMHDGQKVLKVFKSVSDAVKKTGVSQGNLSSCLNGKRLTTGGYYWSYNNIHENPELDDYLDIK